MVDTYQRAITITRVIDGDTIEATVNLGYHTAITGIQYRLARINTPETSGDTKEAGLNAKASTMVWAVTHTAHNGLTAQSTKTDNWKRWLAEITCGQGHNLSDDLLGSGNAVPYKPR